ncbi:MAG: cation-efflux pump [candidate division NC10 bacterium]|nr:cation-efflux pump [candidate division NC10 bacterium]
MASGTDAPMPVGLEASGRKLRVALTSVIAAVGLTATKGIVGWQTGSLGILSEAAHSGLDLVAALITFFAVRMADRPADQDHHYGHEKVENLSALVETALLLLTCLWIIYEALERLFWKHVEIEPSWIAFAVMIGSILADALAAILVAAIVLVVGGRLGKRAVDALLDRAPLDLMERLRAAVKSVPDIQGPVELRARRAGSRLFVDAAVSIGRGASFEGAHAVVDQVEERIRAVAPDASIVIHAEPWRTANESLGEAIRLIVSRHAAGAHDIFIHETGGRPGVDLHLEVPGDMTLAEAHALTEMIEADLRREIPGVGPVHIHVDPLRSPSEGSIRADGEAGSVAARLRRLALSIPGIHDCSHISVRQVGGRTWIACQCAMDGSLSVAEAHELGLELERQARRKIPGLDRVSVHAEPAQP